MHAFFPGRLAELLLQPSGEERAFHRVLEDAFEKAITSAGVELAKPDVQDGHGTLANLAGSHEQNIPG